MIFVARTPLPAELTGPKVDEAQERIVRLISSWTTEHLSQVRIPFDASIWLAARIPLQRLFSNRCAFCETRSDPDGLEVFHYRPTQGARTIKGERDERYYAWLAYDWENLFLLCRECGTRLAHYASVFEVEADRARILASVPECRKTERPILLDPCFDQPGEHIGFGPDGRASDKTKRGKHTIEVFHLNREPLVARRQLVWSEANAFITHMLVRWKSGDLDEAEKLRHTILDLHNGNRSGHVAVVQAALRETWGPAVRLLDAPVTAWEDRLTAAELSEIGKPTTHPRRQKPQPVREDFGPPRTVVGGGVLPDYGDQHIARISIRNFKGIESLELKIPRPRGDDYARGGSLMLLGENATGKSSVLEAVALTLLGTREIQTLRLDLKEFVRRRDWRKPLGEGAPKARIEIFVEEDRPPIWLEIDGTTGAISGSPNSSMILLGYGPCRFFSQGSGSRRRNNPAARVRTMFDTRRGITNPHGWMLRSREDHFNASVRALRPLLLLPDEGLVTRGIPGQFKGGRIMFELRGRSTPLDRMSDGYKTTVATGIDIMREMLRYWPDLESARGVVLIDEVETHLHPRWKMRIIQGLRRAMPGVQFICTTHDPLCLRGMLDGEVTVLRRDEEMGTVALDDLPNVRGLTVEQLLMSDFFGLFSTEDPEQEEEFITYAALANKRDRTPLENEELDRRRKDLIERISPGRSLEAQIAFKAAGEFLLERRTEVGQARSEAERRAIRALVENWKEKEGSTL